MTDTTNTTAMKIITAKKINMHCALVWRVAVMPCKKPSIIIIAGKNHACYNHKWAIRKLESGYYFLHLGFFAITVRIGERAHMRDNGMYHNLAIGALTLGLHGK